MTTPFFKTRSIWPLIAGILAVLGFACQPSTAAAEAELNSIAKPLGALYASPTPLHADVARITLYRTPSQAVGVASLQINDRYQASLQPGGYTDLCMKPSGVDIGASLQITGERPKDLPEVSAFVNLKPRDEVFIRVVDLPKGRLSLVTVPSEVAFAELQQSRRQVHSISRVPGASACDRVTGSPAPQTASITMSTDALFAFGRADVESILPYGREQLDRLVQRLKTRYADFEHGAIQVIGHADPVGNPSANLRLSEARAHAVREYLVSHGIEAHKIESTGRGDKQLLDPSCGRLATPVSIACNKVNRRVVVEMSVRLR
jgi:OOP family OmpA-OmpF porin